MFNDMDMTMVQVVNVMFVVSMLAGFTMDCWCKKASWAADESHSKVLMILIFLMVAYTGKYFCTSCQYVVQNLWLKDQEVSALALSYMFTGGYVGSMGGKIVAGYLADTWGGKKTLVLSTAVFVPCAALFASTPAICEAVGIPFQFHYAVFFFIWCNIGFWGLGFGWVALVGVATNWIPTTHTARYMALAGCAPEFGDVLARSFLAPFVESTGSWVVTWYAAAAASLLLCWPMVLFVGEGPNGYVVPLAAPADPNKPAKEKKTYGTVVKAMLSDPIMLLVCLMCSFLYGIRTVFLLYAVGYLNHVYCGPYGPGGAGSLSFAECSVDPFSVAAVGRASEGFTMLGMVSVLLCGFAKDAMPKRQRSSVLFANMIVLLWATYTMWAMGDEISFSFASLLTAAIGFAVYGPYKTLSGAFAVDLGGKELKATASGFMGVMSNFGAVVMLLVKGIVGEDWVTMHLILIFLALFSTICAGAAWYTDLQRIPAKKEELAKPLLPAEAPTDRVFTSGSTHISEETLRQLDKA